MRNIRLFEKYEDFLASQEVVSGSGKYVQDIHPGFVYVRELMEQGIYAYYNGEDVDEEYQFGDVIYLASDNTLKSVYWTGYTDDLGPKVGLVVVPASHDKDGVARMLAFDNAMASTPMSSVNPGEVRGGDDILLGEAENNPGLFYWTNTWNGDMENYTGLVCWDIPGDGGQPDSSIDTDLYAYMPYNTGWYNYQHLENNFMLSSDISSPVLQNPLSPDEYYPKDVLMSQSSNPEGGEKNLRAVNPSYGSGYYYSEGLFLALSPYLKDGSLNPDYAELEWDDNSEHSPYYNAFADWNGYMHTHTIGSAETSMAAALEYYTPGTQAGDWYVGGLGEMGYVSSRFWAIQYIMNSLGGSSLVVGDGSQEHYNGSYFIFSSTEAYAINGREALCLCISPEDEPYSSSSPLLGAKYPDHQDIPAPYIHAHIEVAPNTSGGYGFQASVRPMAMIKNGEIQRQGNQDNGDNGGIY